MRDIKEIQQQKESIEDRLCDTLVSFLKLHPEIRIDGISIETDLMSAIGERNECRLLGVKLEVSIV